MTKEEILKELNRQGLEDVIELIEDAEEGFLTDLELVESIGLLNDEALNKVVIHLLEQLGVAIIYVTDEDE